MGFDYFKPGRFEYVGSKTIYDFFGIRWYKKYLPSTGDLVMKWRGKKMLHFNNGNRQTVLQEYEKQTRTFETRHLYGLAGFIALCFVTIKPPYLANLLIANSINLLVNIYPIFLQRHNRIRIMKAIEKISRAKKSQ